MELDIIAKTLLISTLGIVGLFIFIKAFPKIARDPKIALYLMVFTAPITQSFGEGAFLHRITISEVMGGLFILTYLMSGQPASSRHPALLSSPLSKYIGILVCIVGLSFFINSYSYERVLQGVEELTVIIYLVVFYLVFIRAVVRDEDVQRVLDVWLLSAVFVVGIGLWDSAGNRLLGLPQIIGPVKEGDQFRVAATFRTTGQLGVYLLSTFFVALAYYFLPDCSRRRRIGVAVLMVGIILLSIFASRRSAIAAFLPGMAVFFLTKVKNPRVSIPASLICAVGFIAVIAFLNEDQDFSGYFYDRVGVLTPEGIGGVDFIELQWKGIVHSFTENPILGVGIGGFLRSRYDLTTNEIHSTYGQLLAETGMLGLIAYALFMLVLVKLTYETGFVLRDPKWSIFAGIIFAAFFGFGVSYMYNRHLRERTFWILVGVITCIYRLAKSRQKSAHKRQADLAKRHRVLPPFKTPWLRTDQ